MRLWKSIYPGLGWLCLIWTLSSLPSHSLPSFKIIGMDKLAHIFVYAVLGLLFIPWIKFKALNRTQILFFFALLLLLATADEYHQTYIPGRSVVVYDLIANAIGLCIALGLTFKKK